MDDVVDELGTREELSYIRTILTEGTGADRQLAVWEKRKDLRAVVDLIIQETKEGLY